MKRTKEREHVSAKNERVLKASRGAPVKYLQMHKPP